MDTFEFGRFAFDIVYVVFMEIMFQNIVGGIMIDAFGSLKEEDGARDEDKSTYCYITGMDKTSVNIHLVRLNEGVPLSKSISIDTGSGTISITSTA